MKLIFGENGVGGGDNVVSIALAATIVLMLTSQDVGYLFHG